MRTLRRWYPLEWKQTRCQAKMNRILIHSISYPHIALQTCACVVLSKKASVTKRSAFPRMMLHLLNAKPKLLSLIIDAIDVVRLSTFGDYTRIECDFVFGTMLFSRRRCRCHMAFSWQVAVTWHRCPYSICVSNLVALRTCQVNLIPMTLSLRKRTRATANTQFTGLKR